jgi:hypothetical protein
VTTAVLALVGSTFALTTAGSAEAGGEAFPRGWPATTSAMPHIDRGAGGPSEVIRLHPVEVSFAEVDLDEDGRFDPGDGFIFRERLMNPRTGNRVGRDLAHCIGMGRVIDCSATLNLHRGKIVVEAASWPGEGLVLAVTGGTYKFRGASGLMHVVEGPGGGTRLIIELD